MESGDWKRAGRVDTEWKDSVFPNQSCVLLRKRSEFALLALGSIHSSPIISPTFCSPGCYFPLHSVLYYCQVNIPKVKIRSHQLD